MNILTDSLPEAVIIDGEEYDLNTDFRYALNVMRAFEDPDLAYPERQAVLLANLYPVLPENLETALALGMKFLNTGKEDQPGKAPALRLFSFEKDAALIYSAFRQTHGIDLETESLHWWKFIALFMDLGADTAFCSLVNLRWRLQTGKATDEETREAREMGDLVDVPEVDVRDWEERLADREAEAEFNRLLEQGQRARAEMNNDG